LDTQGISTDCQIGRWAADFIDPAEKTGSMAVTGVGFVTEIVHSAVNVFTYTSIIRAHETRHRDGEASRNGQLHRRTVAIRTIDIGNWQADISEKEKGRQSFSAGERKQSLDRRRFSANDSIEIKLYLTPGIVLSARCKDSAQRFQPAFEEVPSADDFSTSQTLPAVELTKLPMTYITSKRDYVHKKFSSRSLSRA
jgi:hypothetical protein